MVYFKKILNNSLKQSSEKLNPYEFIKMLTSNLCPVLPVIAPFDFDGPIHAGESVQLNCYVTKGDRPMRIEWHFHSDEVSPHAVGIRTSMFGDRSNILVIESVGPGHRGVYTCTATNSAGVANQSAVLFVNGTLQSHYLSWF